jgi:hypothetical protein
MYRTLTVEVKADTEELLEIAENRVFDAMKYIDGVEARIARTNGVGSDWWHYPQGKRPFADHGEQ